MGTEIATKHVTCAETGAGIGEEVTLIGNSGVRRFDVRENRVNEGV